MSIGNPNNLVVHKTLKLYSQRGEFRAVLNKYDSAKTLVIG